MADSEEMVPNKPWSKIQKAVGFIGGSQQRPFSRMRGPWGPCIGKALPLPLYELEGAINGWTSYSSICQAQDSTLDDIGDSRGLGVGARTLWRWDLMD